MKVLAAFFSVHTPVAQSSLCGGVIYSLNRHDSSIVTIDESTNVITINTRDNSLDKTTTVIEYKVFLENYSMISKTFTIYVNLISSDSEELP